MTDRLSKMESIFTDTSKAATSKEVKTAASQPAVKRIPESVTPEQPESELRADIYTERITLPLSPEQKDFIEGIVKRLTRQTKVSKKLVNKNTIIRALVEALQSADLSQLEGALVRTESDINDLIGKVLRY